MIDKIIEFFKDSQNRTFVITVVIILIVFIVLCTCISRIKENKLLNKKAKQYSKNDKDVLPLLQKNTEVENSSLNVENKEIIEEPKDVKQEEVEGESEN